MRFIFQHFRQLKYVLAYMHYFLSIEAYMSYSTNTPILIELLGSIFYTLQFQSNNASF